MTGLAMLFLEKRETLGLSTRKAVEHCKQSVGAWKMAVLGARWTTEAPLRRLQRGAIVAARLKSILRIFWQRM